MRALLTGLLAIGLCAAGLGQQAAAADFGEPLPSFAELEAAGAVIGKILVDPQDIFDEADPRENYGLYRLLNTLHINTRASVIRRQLLFRSGDRVSRQRIEETERLLRANSYLYDVSVRPVALRQGVVAGIRFCNAASCATALSNSAAMSASATRAADCASANCISTLPRASLTTAMPASAKVKPLRMLRPLPSVEAFSFTHGLYRQRSPDWQLRSVTQP